MSKKNNESEIKTKEIEKYIPKCEIENLPLKTPDGSDITVKVKKFISFDEAESFINHVVTGILNNGSVAYCAKDFLIRLSTIRFYTDIDVPDDFDKQYSLVCCTSLVEEIRQTINDRQYQSILDSIEQQLQYEMQRRLYDLKEEAEEILKTFKSFEQIFSGISKEELQGTLNKISKASDSQEILQFLAKKDAKQRKQKSSKPTDGKVVQMNQDGDGI